MGKYFLIGVCLFVVLVAYTISAYIRLNDGKLHVIFCDVGQGDAILIRSPSGVITLVDGGPDEKVLSCLSEHLPFWQRSVSVLILSHPHADHYAGMLGVLDSYSVQNFATEELRNDTVLFQALEKRLVEKKIKTRYLLAGDAIRLKDGVTISVLGPSKKYLQSTSPNGQIGERAEFASLILHITYGEFSVLLTGDSQASGISDALRNSKVMNVSVLQVPHHGSRTGLTPEILDQLKPQLAVFSVGKNSYGHPSQAIADMLSAKGIEQKETIKEGDIEVLSDGKTWLIKR